MSLVIALIVTGAVPVLRNTKVSLLCHSMEKACSSGAGLSASAIFSMASRWRVAFASAFSAASRAFFEALACHQENAAPTIVKTAHTAVTTFAADSKSSSSVRCGCRTISCGVCGAPNLTEEDAASMPDPMVAEVANRHPIGIEARLESAFGGAEGGGGLSGSSARTPAGRTVRIQGLKFLRRREDGLARE